MNVIDTPQKLKDFVLRFTGNKKAIDGSHEQAWMEEDFEICTTIFKRMLPVREAYKIWLERKGVKQAIAGTHSDKNFIPIVQRTIKWAESGFNQPIPMCIDPEDNDFDFLDNIYRLIIVSERVLEYFRANHKGEFEHFDVKNMYKETKEKYYLINITNQDFEFKFSRKFKGLDNVWKS